MPQKSKAFGFKVITIGNFYVTICIFISTLEDIEIQKYPDFFGIGALEVEM